MRGERIEVRALDIVDNRHGSKVEAFASAIHICRRFRGKNAEAETIRDVNAVAVGAKRSAGYRHHDDEDDVHAASGAGPCR